MATFVKRIVAESWSLVASGIETLEVWNMGDQYAAIAQTDGDEWVLQAVQDSMFYGLFWMDDSHWEMGWTGSWYDGRGELNHYLSDSEEQAILAEIEQSRS